MAQPQHATEHGSARAQSAPFGYDGSWLAQQNGHMHFGFSDTFSFDQQQPQQQSGGHSGSILDQNDNSLLGDFFSNPEITNQMDFNFSTAPDGQGNGDDSKLSIGNGFFDLDEQSGTIEDPSPAFSGQHFSFGGDIPGRSYPNGNTQHVNFGGHTPSNFDDHEQQSDATEEEETKAKVAESLAGMSTNRQDPTQMLLGSNVAAFAGGQSWGNLSMGSPYANMHGMQSLSLSGRWSADRSRLAAFPPQNGHAPHEPFGYAFGGSQRQTPQNLASSMHMPQYAHAGQSRGRPHSMADIRTPAFTHLPSNEPRSAQLPGTAYPNFAGLYNNARPVPNTLRFDSDNSFHTNGPYRPSSEYDPDEKAANLSQVPGAREASAGSRSRGPSAAPPHAGSLHFQAHEQQPQAYMSHFSQPSTPTFYGSNQNFLGGLPRTPSGGPIMSSSDNAYGSFGTMPFNHAHPRPQYWPSLPSNRARTAVHDSHELHDTESKASSSEHEDSETDSPALAASTGPARKRRKSEYEREAEDDYQPSDDRSKRRVNSTLNGSSDEDEYGPASSPGRKRARVYNNRHGSSAALSPSEPSSPAMHSPRPTSASESKRSARKRQSGTHIPRAPLTDEQRRQNHIKSEKNRRDLIKTNYTELNNIIPALKNGKSGLSKSEVLNEIVEFIEELVVGNEHMEGLLANLTPGSFREYQHSTSGGESDGAGGTAGSPSGVEAY